MNSMTDYLESAWINTLRGTAYSVPALYVALMTTAPSETGSGQEVTDGAYQRQQVTLTDPSQESDLGTTSNSQELVFPAASTDWGTVTHAAIFDASAGGNMLLYAALDREKKIEPGDQLRIPAGSLKLSLG